MGKIKWGQIDALESVAKSRREHHNYTDLSKVYVPGEGDNPIAFIFGEAPGAVEETQRRPFVGPAGQVLRDLMDIAGLNSTPTNTVPEDGWMPNCWLTNVVKFRPPRNRTPTLQEINSFRDLLRLEWLAVGKPQIIIPVGSVALTAVYGRQMSSLKHAGTMLPVLSSTGDTLFIWPMLHPSFGLRNPEVQPKMEEHWQHLGEWLDNNDSPLAF